MMWLNVHIFCVVTLCCTFLIRALLSLAAIESAMLRRFLLFVHVALLTSGLVLLRTYRYLFLSIAWFQLKMLLLACYLTGYAWFESPLCPTASIQRACAIIICFCLLLSMLFLAFVQPNLMASF